MMSPRCPAIAAFSFGAGVSSVRQVLQSGRMIKRRINAYARRATLGLALVLLASGTGFFSQVSAQQAADCQRLKQAIADASRSDSSGEYQAAAERQRAELDRTTAYARSIGCDRKQFLFFGAAPPPQCGEINAQIGRMRGNLDELQNQANGGPGGRNDLIARYNAQCAAPTQPANFLDALFGGGRPNDVQTMPLSPDQLDSTEAQAGAKAVCVRSCDGAFFPVSYSASSGRLGGLEDMCRALCPNAEVSLYTYPASGQIEQAVSISGARYVDSPNALKFRQSFDSSCSCKRRGDNWADALAGAEAKLGRESKGDVYVTAEKSIELSRPKIDPKAKPKPGDKPAAQSADVDALSQAAATISRETSGIAGGDAQQSASRYGQDQGQTVESVGPDGVKRRVRLIDPTL
ncbi:MAG: DUF2865 domain-containing protein [Bradyrhizobium sp.]|nr:MAG: DUF2865 domain-containing protein [Bradyrhizobium sp.]